MLSCPWHLQYNSLALFPAHDPVKASTAVAELMEEDKKEGEDSDTYIDEGSTEYLVSKQVSAEVEEEGTALAQEEGATAE